MKYRVISIILFTTTIPIYLTSKPVADSLKMDYRDDTEPENEVWHS